MGHILGEATVKGLGWVAEVWVDVDGFGCSGPPKPTRAKCVNAEEGEESHLASKPTRRELAQLAGCRETSLCGPQAAACTTAEQIGDKPHVVGWVRCQMPCWTCSRQTGDRCNRPCEPFHGPHHQRLCSECYRMPLSVLTRMHWLWMPSAWMLVCLPTLPTALPAVKSSTSKLWMLYTGRHYFRWARNQKG